MTTLHSSWSFLYPRKQAGDVFENQAMGTWAPERQARQERVFTYPRLGNKLNHPLLTFPLVPLP